MNNWWSEIPTEARIGYYETITKWFNSMWIGADGGLLGYWVMGQDYRVKSGYHGGYPAGYLTRIRALLPEIDELKVLHLFSGKVDTETFPGDTVDSDIDNWPTYVDNAETLLKVPLEKYDLVLADPPYTGEDAERYGTCMVSRKKVFDTLARRLRPGAVVVWLDQASIMYRKTDWTIVGRIAMEKSTNHRFRSIKFFRCGGAGGL